MYKAKLCIFAIVCMVGFAGISPITAFAAETKPESVTPSEKNKDQKDKRAAFEEKMKKASEKWKTLTTKQKDEVYVLLDDKMKTENKIMDKLVELGVIAKEDATVIKANMLDRYNKLKASGEFPLMGQKRQKIRK